MIVKWTCQFKGRGGVNRTDDLRVNRTWQFWGGLNRTEDREDVTM